MRSWILLAFAGCGRIAFDEVAADAPGPDASTEVRGPGTWTQLPPSGLAPRVWTRAIWSGRDFVVFGGALDMAYTPTNDGARFDPSSMTWTPIDPTNAPTPRHSVALVHAGDSMFAYGGAAGLDTLEGGGVYDLSSGTWTPMPSDPGLRIYSNAHDLGDGRVLLYAGLERDSTHWNSGLLYSLAANTWTPISTTGAPSPRSFAATVWTGSELIAWGGCNGAMPACPNIFGDGAIYSPASDSWRPMSATNAPQARAQRTAVWTGSEVIYFGGVTEVNEGGRVSTGAIYTPATDTWRPISTTNAPGPRSDHAAAWLGTKMIIWGSSDGLTDGYLYDPAIDEWSKISSGNAPTSRSRFAYASDGRRLFVWGGTYDESAGALWTPE